MKCKDCTNYECSNRGDGERECVYINGPYRFFGTPTMPFFDWQSFRAEAAKDILCAVLSGGITSGMVGIVPEKENLVKVSIEIADELVKRLKEREEK